MFRCFVQSPELLAQRLYLLLFSWRLDQLSTFLCVAGILEFRVSLGERDRFVRRAETRSSREAVKVLDAIGDPVPREQIDVDAQLENSPRLPCHRLQLVRLSKITEGAHGGK